MSLQKRLVAVVALLLVVGLVVADIVTYASVHSFLFGQADNTLAQNESLGFNYVTYAAERGVPVTKADLSRRVSADVYVQLVDHSGKIVLSRPSGSIEHPDPAPILTKGIPVQQVPDIGSRVRVGRFAGAFHPDPDAVVLGSTGDPDGQYRTVAVTVPQGTLVTSISLNPTNDTLASLRKVEITATLAVLLAMGLLVFLVVRRGLRPLRQMAGTADAIASGDLTRRVPEGRPGTEIGRLGSALNEMLTQIEVAFDEKSASEERLRQFVADASHELRTPITSLRTNIEVLMAGDALSEDDRHRLLADVLEQSEELSALIGDVIELARGDLPITSAEDIRLDQLVAECLTRARRDFPDVRFESSFEPLVIDGVPERLARAVNNLLDNAAHHSAAGGLVEVTVDEHGVQVRDHGTGIDPADLPYVFDRFFRGANSRGRQGSGLGLAIVRQTALQHGGSVQAANGPDGGAIFTLRLPIVTEDQLDRADDEYPVATDPLALS